MAVSNIHIDDNLREKFQFNDASFPLDIGVDRYKDFPSATLPLHWHDFVEFDFVLSGTVRFTVNSETFTLSPGECLYISSGTLHTAVQTGDEHVDVLVIAFRPELLAGGLQGTVHQKYIRPLTDKGIHGCKIDPSRNSGKNLIETLRRMPAIPEDAFGYELRVLSIISEAWLLLNEYLSQFSPAWQAKLVRQTARMKEMLAYIHNAYKSSIKIDELASHGGISRAECFRCFKRYTGKTPVEYLNNYRLSQAANMLITTELSIVEIGLACGFESQSYFGKLFKENYGVTPLRFRKNAVL